MLYLPSYLYAINFVRVRMRKSTAMKEYVKSVRQANAKSIEVNDPFECTEV